MAVEYFLTVAGVPQYAEHLISSGFDDILTICDMSQDDMQSFVILPGHCVKLKREIKEEQWPPKNWILAESLAEALRNALRNLAEAFWPAPVHACHGSVDCHLLM